MKLRISVQPEALFDIHEARDWYERQLSGLGDDFLHSVSSAFELIEGFPEAFQIVYLQFRRAVTNRFPYRVYDQIDGSVVIIARVLHTSRDHVRELK